ncbi:MAG TPA: hypothetical protein H9845_08150 [Candidatus Agathobaculum pullicola]|nr:hypothetical protein [Candidatus Agathobaculum pullicola]
MNIASLKKSVILGMANATTVDMFKENSVILLTAAGMISGKLIEKSDLESFDQTDKSALSTFTVSTITQKSKEEFDKQSDSELNVTGNDGYIILKDVHVTNVSGQTMFFSALTVFFDQIIGVTLGSVQVNN